MNISGRRALANLADLLVEDILSMTDEEIMAEAAEEGIDIVAEARKFRAMLDRIAKDISVPRLPE